MGCNRPMNQSRIADGMATHGLELSELLKAEGDSYCAIIITADRVRLIHDDVTIPRENPTSITQGEEPEP